MNLHTLPIAGFGPETLAVFIPIIALMIPIVAILVNHQRKMAEIIHGGTNSAAQAELYQLRGEVAELRERVNQQAIQLDGVRSQVREIGSGSSLSGNSDLSSRLNL